MDFNQYFTATIGVVLAISSFFITRWINRLDEDRKSLEKRAELDHIAHEKRILSIEGRMMSREEAQKWIGRLDREREIMSTRLEDIEKAFASRADIVSMIQDLKNDINIRFQELREDVRLSLNKEVKTYERRN